MRKTRSSLKHCLAVFLAMSTVYSTAPMTLAQQQQPQLGQQAKPVIGEDTQKSAQEEQQPAPNGQQPAAQKPLGTAAAPYEKPEGIAASRPAGAAIAPAKQRRVRTILIRVGVIVGAGVAIGTVAALSHASPSTPPK